MVNSFTDVIDALGGTAKFARAVGMKPNTAKMAKARGSISPAWWTAVAGAAVTVERHDITVEKLAELAARRRAA
jgi:hypothetical protein